MSEPLGRLPLLGPEALAPTQQELYRAIAAGPRATGPFSVVDDRGRLLGPFNALLYAPGIGAAVERLGAALRFEGSLDARARELVICAVAVHWDSDYEWYAHAAVARASGVSEAELEQVRAGAVPATLNRSEESALRLATALLRERAVEAELYELVVADHGADGVVELCALVGYYQLLAGLLAAADVPAPADEEEHS